VANAMAADCHSQRAADEAAAVDSPVLYDPNGAYHYRPVNTNDDYSTYLSPVEDS